MDELFAWLERLKEMAQQPEAGFGQRLHRVVAPSSIDFDGRMIRVQDVDQEVWSFPNLPWRLAVLIRPDLGSRGGSFEDQAVAAQLGALLTLVTNRRVEVAAADVAVGVEGSERHTFMPSNFLQDRSLTGPVGGDVGALWESMLRKIYGLPELDRAVVAAAIELHYTSVLLVNVEPNAAYALCTAGIERLSRRFGEPTSDWETWEDAKRLDTAFQDLGLTDLQIRRLRDELLANRHLRLRQTFARYVVETLQDDFWALDLEDFVPMLTMDTASGDATFVGWRPETPTPVASVVPRERDELRRRLLASYDSRSSYVHEGTRRTELADAVRLRLGEDVGPKAPLPFAALRLILRSLIMQEVESRTSGRELPVVLLFHPGNEPGTPHGAS